MELTKDDYDILIDLLESEMSEYPEGYCVYKEYKRLRDTLVFIRDKNSFEEFKRREDALTFIRDKEISNENR